jgi:basic membrane protein A and related proteins
MKFYTLLAVLIMGALIIGACAPTTTPEPTAPQAPAAPQEPTAPQEPAPSTSVLACQVTDTGGIDDRSFNATAWKGVEDAQAQLGVEGKVLESQQQADYENFINAFIEEGCDLIITVGFLLGDATETAAQQNPDQDFTIVDYAYEQDYANILGLVFATDEAAFLAGYVAAGVTQTGYVGTFGGIQIPPVTIFMDGFAMGVQEYNSRHGTNVEVLGWDMATQTGLFTGNFDSLDDGRTLGETLISQGADIIMPVAGPVGLGTAAAAQEHQDVYLIGVDTDWTVSSPEYTNVLLTSVMKKMDVAVFESIEMVVDGTFSGGLFVGTLSNDGVGLAPFHQLADKVPSDLQAELDEIRQAIIAGQLQTSP